jgi:hypothetical protein
LEEIPAFFCRHGHKNKERETKGAASMVLYPEGRKERETEGRKV